MAEERAETTHLAVQQEFAVEGEAVVALLWVAEESVGLEL
jgi:hypothetical protein